MCALFRVARRGAFCPVTAITFREGFASTKVPLHNRTPGIRRLSSIWTTSVPSVFLVQHPVVQTTPAGMLQRNTTLARQIICKQSFGIDSMQRRSLVKGLQISKRQSESPESLSAYAVRYRTDYEFRAREQLRVRQYYALPSYRERQREYELRPEVHAHRMECQRKRRQKKREAVAVLAAEHATKKAERAAKRKHTATALHNKFENSQSKVPASERREVRETAGTNYESLDVMTPQQPGATTVLPTTASGASSFPQSSPHYTKKPPAPMVQPFTKRQFSTCLRRRTLSTFERSSKHSNQLSMSFLGNIPRHPVILSALENRQTFSTLHCSYSNIPSQPNVEERQVEDIEKWSSSVEGLSANTQHKDLKQDREMVNRAMLSARNRRYYASHREAINLRVREKYKNQEVRTKRAAAAKAYNDQRRTDDAHVQQVQQVMRERYRQNPEIRQAYRVRYLAIISCKGKRRHRWKTHSPHYSKEPVRHLCKSCFYDHSLKLWWKRNGTVDDEYDCHDNFVKNSEDMWPIDLTESQRHKLTASPPGNKELDASSGR